MNFLNHPIFAGNTGPIEGAFTVLFTLFGLWVLVVFADWLRQPSRALRARMKAAAEAAEKEIAYKLQRNDLIQELLSLEQECDEARAYAEKGSKDKAAAERELDEARASLVAAVEAEGTRVATMCQQNRADIVASLNAQIVAWQKERNEWRDRAKIAERCLDTIRRAIAP